jgi:hypothetical protein
MTRTAGWLLVVGAALFAGAAFSPASYVFGIREADARRAHLQKHARSWPWAQVLFAAGAAVSAVGLVALGDETGSSTVTGAGALALLASAPWAAHCRRRALAVDDFLEGRLPGWQSTLYFWGTLAALALTGAGMLGTDLPRWTAWFVLGTTALLVAVLLRFRDLPPFLFYVVTAVVGVVAL